MIEDYKAEADAVQAMAVAAMGANVVESDAKPYVMVPDGYSLKDMEGTMSAPTRSRGTVHLRDVTAFIVTVNKFKNEAATIYRQVHPKPEFSAVFNDDTATQPGWGDHVAHYACPLSPEWQAWANASGKPMAQNDFALFIERNLPDIRTFEDDEGASLVTATEMLEVSRSLQAKKKVNFASGTRLDNGEIQFRYEEQIEGTVGKGDLKVPELFLLGIPVFEGGTGYAVLARLRYRIGERGDLSMWFDLERPHKIVEDAVEQLAKQIEAETGLKAINGTRPATKASGIDD